ncbi:hypothetical protein K440DRAFT_617460 [Wilcoxina mikolae CBS 423.85]|nr:hypothetical protein K440DRAFT_617460 [Wilcoxina mikolae CBS 423.85]
MKRTSYQYLAALLLLHAFSVVDAQSSTPVPTPQAEHVITVGKAAHKFAPDLVRAAVGDLITFEFYPTNHSVVRGALDFPCIPYEKVTPEVTGFFGGFHPVKTIPKDPPRWSVVVNDTNPIFFYCSAPDSCNVWGMVGVINPAQDSDLDKYRSGSKNASYVLQPGQDWPSEAESNTAAVHSPTIPPTSSSTGPTSAAEVTITASPTHSPAAGNTQSLSTGGIAGVAIGAAAVVGLIGGLFFFLGRKKSAPPATPAPEKPISAAYPSPHPSTFSAFRPGVDPAYGFPGYAPPDPRSFPPRSVGTTSPLGDDYKPYGGWRESRQSTLRGGRPVEIDSDGRDQDERERESWVAGGYTSPGPGVYPQQVPSPPGVYPPQGPPPPQGWYPVPGPPSGRGPPSTTTVEPSSNNGGSVEPLRPGRDESR